MAIPGSIVWTDLTVPDAGALRAFYSACVGWTFSDHAMGDYADYNVKNSAGDTVAGLCHARGVNAHVPPAWLIYVDVPSVGVAARAALAHGGGVLDGPRAMGGHQFAVIRDPAGAVFAVIGPA